MRALALVTDAFGGYGGIARYNQEFLSALAAAPGIEDVHVLPRVGACTDPLPPKLRQESPVPSRVLYALTAMRIAISQKIDLIFCGHLYHSPLAVLLARFTRARLVCQTHGVEVGERPPPHQRLSMEQADTILCVSRDTRAKVLRWANIAPERAVVLSNTVDDIFTPGDGSRMRQLAGVREAKVLLSVSRLDSRQQHKGQDRVIEAMPGLLAAGLEVVYLVAGEGDDQPRLEALARARGVADRVRFLGHVPQADLPDLYRAADLFVLPSTGEGFGIVFLEAMACGTPALGFALGGAVDALEAGGFCVEPTQEALREGIARALTSSPQAKRTLSTNTRQLFGAPMFRQRVGQLI